MYGSHIDRRTARCWVALACVALLGFMLAAEAVHPHPIVERAGPASHCSICIVAHGTAPAVAVLLPVAVAPAFGSYSWVVAPQ